MTRDVGLILAGQKAEHYEIATYGGLITLAKTLGLTQAAKVMAQTLAEEKAADEKLTDIAETCVNQAASEE
jgi:ferritin-like metal-binding protein YciE